MLSLQHAMYMVYYKGNDNLFLKDMIAQTLLPDALRYYTHNRQYTHFEWNEDKTDYSYFVFPKMYGGIKDKTYFINAVQNADRYLVADITPCAIGEETNLDGFYAHNQHLFKEYLQMFHSIEMHLIEDVVFDEFIREVIDCHDKYNDKYYYNGNELNGKEVRSLIEEIEQVGIYVLAEMLYQKEGIVANNDWVQSFIKPSLELFYPNELVNNTIKYMKIDDKINEYITNKDYTHFEEFNISKEELVQMYEKVAEKLAPSPQKLQHMKECLDMEEDYELL